MKKSIESLRASITIPKGVTYLNWASVGIIPDEALQAIASFLKLHGRIDVDLVSHEFGATTRARELAAKLIGASPEHICLTTNTSIGINLAAQGIPFEPGDEVLLPEAEFPTNVVPWYNLEKKGIKVRTLKAEHQVPFAELLDAQIGPRTKALSISFVQFHDGYRHDLAAIAAICRKRGLYFVVDAMQGLGVCPLSVRDLGVDFLACGGAKWLSSPYGTGFCYFSPRMLERIDWLPAHGWLAYEYIGHDFTRILGVQRRLFPDARKFEVGTLPYHDFAGFNYSVGLLLGVRIEAVYSHVSRLYERLVVGLEGTPGVKIVSCLEPATRSGILCFASPDNAGLHKHLTDERVFTSHREGAIRVSIHGFSDESDIDRLLSATEDFTRTRRPV
ncbi:MAG: aminotransferase class V-fold PLP-dependent enzyme [Candidatus Coatesbacteria bacterium]|nr:aminotransferase class V-fold PLP-dependent enzyme [Candidatus Coatesbacteria bacterium]